MGQAIKSGSGITSALATLAGGFTFIGQWAFAAPYCSLIAGGASLVGLLAQEDKDGRLAAYQERIEKARLWRHRAQRGIEQRLQTGAPPGDL